ncbi:MAG: thioredoxin family protein, partial [bacterium]|nr:thioredoxin family protein [bacterium]
VDLGATKCVPCKMMAPVLEELRTEYKGQLIVEFIDVWENSSAGEKYGINSIPTQIFFDETGKEVFRHVGFFPKEDILSTFKAHGINLEKGK